MHHEAGRLDVAEKEKEDWPLLNENVNINNML